MRRKEVKGSAGGKREGEKHWVRRKEEGESRKLGEEEGTEGLLLWKGGQRMGRGEEGKRLGWVGAGEGQCWYSIYTNPSPAIPLLDIVRSD